MGRLQRAVADVRAERRAEREQVIRLHNLHSVRWQMEDGVVYVWSPYTRDGRGGADWE